MKTKILLLMLSFGIIVNTYGQNIELSFTAIENTTNVQLDSIKVINYTQGVDTILYWPDTVLILYQVGIIINLDENSNFKIQQNYPNPVVDKTTININIPDESNIRLTIADILGRQVISTNMLLKKGIHEFSFKPGNSEIYLFTVSINNTRQSIKILNARQGSSGKCFLEYIGRDDFTLQTKSTRSQEFSFTPGDILLYIGYIDTQQSGLQDSPETSDDYVFQFATNIPCPGIPNIDYGGQIYNTIQVYGQCWMNENLNIGDMLYVPEMQTDNNIIEKYCLGDMETYCNTYGGLYFWNEMMNYTTETGGQGICPEGWHIPDDIDWQILEGAVDSEFKIGDSEWSNFNWRGMDAGGNLKQTGTQFWTPPNTGATDAFGFSTLPSGYYVQGSFWGIWYKSYHWSSDRNHKYYRNIDWDQTKIKRVAGDNQIAISVRCVKDN